MLNRGDYWQCAFVIAKGSARRRCAAEGLEAFRATRRRTGASSPPSAWRDRLVGPDVKLLTVQVNRLREWCSARPAVHRRRRARHVAGRRRRHQPRDPGRGGGGERALQGRLQRRGAARSAATARVPDPRSRRASRSRCRTTSCSACWRIATAIAPPLAVQLLARYALPAAHPGAHGRRSARGPSTSAHPRLLPETILNS